MGPAGERLGKVGDLIVRLGQPGYPPITGFLVSVAGRQAFRPAEGVSDVGERGVTPDRGGRDLAHHRPRSYRSAERVFVWLTIPFFAYPVAAILAHPDWSKVGHALAPPHVQTSSAYLVLFVATAGTTVTPYMQPYLQSATVERGAREEDLPAEQRRAVAGAIFADLVAAFIIVATGATLYEHGVHTVSSAGDTAKALKPFAGRYAEALFGIGLLGASLLACAILPIAPSYVVAESLGFEKGLGRSVGEAPVFVGLITAMIAIATAVPGIPVIGLLVGVQVVNGVCCRSTCSSSGASRAAPSSWASGATRASSTRWPPSPSRPRPPSRSSSSP